MPETKDFVTFAPANREASVRKKIRHVPRHIELTAVPMQIGTNKIRVIESEDLRITTRPSVKN